MKKTNNKMDKLYKELAKTLAKVIDARYFVVYRYETSRDAFLVVGSNIKGLKKNGWIPLKDTNIAVVLFNKSIYIENNSKNSSIYIYREVRDVLLRNNAMYIPIFRKDEVHFIIELINKNGHYDDSDIEYVKEIFSSQVYRENISLQDNKDSTPEYMKKLKDLLQTSLDIQYVLTFILETILNVLSGEVGFIKLFSNAYSIDSDINISWGIDEDIVKNMYIIDKNMEDYIKGLAGGVLISAKNIKIDIEKTRYRNLGTPNIQSMLISPLIVQKKVIGYIITANKLIHHSITNFTPRDIGIFQTIISNLELYLENYMLYRRYIDVSLTSEIVLKNITSGIMITDLEGYVMFANDYLLSMLGFRDKSMVIGRHYTQILQFDRRGFLTVKETADKYKNVFETEYYNPATQITSILEISISNFKNEKNYITGSLIIVNDITDKKHLERRTVISERLAFLGELISSIAHEIKNPLTSIMGFTRLLPKKFDDKEFRKKYIKIMNDEVNKLNRLIENLHSFAKPRKGEIELVSIKDLIERARELLRYEMQKKGIEFIVDIDEDYKININEQHLYQILLNILLNSIQAIKGDNGKIRVSENIVKQDVFKGHTDIYMIITIEDNGIGIERKDLSRIFDPFFTTKENGTGLGLAISYRIIKEYGGYIDVNSIPGEGTKVDIYLPYTLEYIRGTND